MVTALLVLVSADVDRSSSPAVVEENNASGLIGFPGKNINRKKQEAKPTGGRPFNSNESITCAPTLALLHPRGGSTQVQIIVGMLGLTWMKFNCKESMTCSLVGGQYS